MAAIVGAVVIVVLMASVLTRVVVLRRAGVQAAKFGEIDKTDFFIPPFALLYFYLIFAHAFGWPSFANRAFFSSVAAAWLGVALCLAGLVVLWLAIIDFGTSFRIGIDTGKPGELVTNGIFARTRNPIYVGFAFVLCGEFLIFPHPVLLLYVAAGFALFHRQVLREESFLRERYGDAFRTYAARVPRYLF
ncbi:MAG TPA: isoprenylcysteine carboxylmethyltransferase family protein [Candidatus Baltobacteraceae bacterium]|nr:isoprenylcysteine carboxylmethyltransferase family protein [Candidatus Baltobacteraceae bacterium]